MITPSRFFFTCSSSSSSSSSSRLVFVESTVKKKDPFSQPRGDLNFNSLVGVSIIIYNRTATFITLVFLCRGKKCHECCINFLLIDQGYCGLLGMVRNFTK